MMDQRAVSVLYLLIDDIVLLTAAYEGMTAMYDGRISKGDVR
jgi:hypothetical protein